MEKLKWGMIGCGDVAELKSGPAFNKIANSSLYAVMRRDSIKAEDYAMRHGVPHWYANAFELINDSEINAIYIATPPSSHEEYALAAIAAGKPVYVEKPMALDQHSAERITDAAIKNKVKLVVAHYRREQPMFKKIRQLLDEGRIGTVQVIDLSFFRKPLTASDLQVSKTAWRVDPEIAGGGLFHDMAPHQIDLMLYFFGKVKQASGVAVRTNEFYKADDIISGHILFDNNIVFSGIWNFQYTTGEEIDRCEIIGTKGRIIFSVFDKSELSIETSEGVESINFDPIQHVQQPMIEQVVKYFLGEADNPCPGSDGVRVMGVIDKFTRK